MIHLSHTLGMRVVAEGVEQESQQEFLRLNGCDEIQGYFTGRPVSVDDMQKLLEKMKTDFQG